MKNWTLSLAAHAAHFLPASIKRRLYRLGPITRLIRGTLNWGAPEGLTEVKISSGELKGAYFQLDLQSEKDYWLGTYETDLQKVIPKFVQPGMTAYDVGANVGYVSLLLGKAVGASGQVYSFEALPSNVDRLQTNLDLNSYISQYTLVGKAVTDKSGMIDFFVHESDDMGKAVGSAGRDAVYANTIKVSSVSLDDFVYQENHPVPDVVKIDIEGGEVLALPGMQRLLTDARPLVLIELHGPESAKAVLDALHQANYTIHLMKPNYPMVTILNELDWKAYLVGKPPHG